MRASGSSAWPDFSCFMPFKGYLWYPPGILLMFYAAINCVFSVPPKEILSQVIPFRLTLYTSIFL